MSSPNEPPTYPGPAGTPGDETPVPASQPGQGPSSWGHDQSFAGQDPYGAQTSYGTQDPYGAQQSYPGQPPHAGQAGQGAYAQGQYGQPQYAQGQYPQGQYGQPPYPQGQYAHAPYPGQPGYDWYPPDARSRAVAGVLGIILGGFGIHRFYLGYVGIGIAQIAVTLVTFGVGAIWGFVEGILYLVSKTGTYSVDAEGRPLRP